MKSVLIITGDPNQFGSGHSMRMHSVALELRKHKIVVQKISIAPDAEVDVPLPYSLAILDRRDTAFNPPVLENAALKIAVDNRGTGREQADIACDLLPHLEMTKKEYATALQNVILSPEILASPCKSLHAQLTLHNSQQAAFAAADFFPRNERLSPEEFIHHLTASIRPALYFGQALFEALYLGLNVQLYSVSKYHEKLAVDLFSRMLLEPDLLKNLTGNGLEHFCNLIQKHLKENMD